MHKLTLTLLLITLAAPGYTADDSAFFVEKKKFKKTYHSVIIAPVEANPAVAMPPEVGALLMQEVTRGLTREGFDVTPSSEYQQVRETMEAQVGGLRDPNTGVLDQAKLKAVRDHSHREVLFRHPTVDAVVRVRVSTVSADFASARAEWDGVKSKIKGVARKYSGTIAASSVLVTMYSRSNELLYANRGGIEVLMHGEDGNMMPLPTESLFQNEKQLKKAVGIALKPI